MLMESLPKESDSKWDELSEDPQIESYGDEQDITDVRAIQALAKAYFEKRHAMAPEQAGKEAHNLADIQLGFIQQRKRDKERGRETSEEEFLKWEAEFAGSWDKMQQFIKESGMTIEKEAEIEAPVFFSEDKSKIEETVDAQAGRYYDKRNQELRNAIFASNEKTKDSDMRIVGTFLQTVMMHVGFRYMMPDDIREQYGDDAAAFESFDRARTAAHNSVIKHLNKLNELAEKYGTTRFTPRDFWTSERPHQTQDIAKRMKYDRKAVEAYYTLAFSSEIDEEERRHRNSARFY